MILDFERKENVLVLQCFYFMFFKSTRFLEVSLTSKVDFDSKLNLVGAFTCHFFEIVFTLLYY